MRIKPHPPAAFDAEWARRSEAALAVFIRQAWPILEPGTAYLQNWHIDAIAEFLEAVTAGEITRLLINMPPRYMKSIAVSVLWPCWEWLRRPETRWMFASYSGSLATDHNLDRRTVIQSDWYQTHWGDRFQLAADANVKTQFRNNRRGMMIATGFKGTATGKGGDRIVIDDPHDPLQAESDRERETTVRTFRRKFTTRLNNKKRGAIVVVMQRLHEEDVSALCLELGYTHLCLPGEAKTRTIVTLPRSGRTIVREPGDLLWPEREGPAEIAAQKQTLGSYGYAGQYDQDPAPTEGGILKRHWWRFWQPRDSKPLPPVTVRLPDGSLHQCPVIALPEHWDLQVQSWDMGYNTDIASKDYVVGQVWGRHSADYFLLDQSRDRRDLPDTLQAVRDLTTAWPQATSKWVEHKANGPAVIRQLQHEIPGMIGVEPDGGKQVRAQAITPLIEAGNVYLPHPRLAPWVDAFINECATFPNGAHDDQVDALSQALVRLQIRETGWLAQIRATNAERRAKLQGGVAPA